MNKIVFAIVLFTLLIIPSSTTYAQITGGGFATDDHTAQEEADGKALWRKLQNKETDCASLSDDDFGAVGEYFMGQMMGNAHPAMNRMMVAMVGEDGEEQIHIVMGERLSCCDTSAIVPSQAIGFMPMMSMMMGGWSSPFNNNSTINMMNFGFGSFGSFGFIFMILWWVLIIVGIVALIKWLTNQSRSTRDQKKSALDILKERYARGEIDKKEFEQKKKDLSL